MSEPRKSRAERRIDRLVMRYCRLADKTERARMRALAAARRWQHEGGL